jgi:hypothetical protein
MLAELQADWQSGRIALDPRLNENGRRVYVALLDAAVRFGSDATLAAETRRLRLLSEKETARTPAGDVIEKRVPSNAAEVLSEWDFNRYYVRGVCLRALQVGVGTVEVYRAKDVREPRRGSERKVGKFLDALRLLDDLRRASAGEAGKLGVPAGFGSGLSVKLRETRPSE